MEVNKNCFKVAASAAAITAITAGVSANKIQVNSEDLNDPTQQNTATQTESTNEAAAEDASKKYDKAKANESVKKDVYDKATQNAKDKKNALDAAESDYSSKKSAYDTLQKDLNTKNDIYNGVSAKYKALTEAKAKAVKAHKELDDANKKLDELKRTRDAKKTAYDNAMDALAKANDKMARADALEYKHENTEFINDEDFVYLNEYVDAYKKALADVANAQQKADEADKAVQEAEAKIAEGSDLWKAHQDYLKDKTETPQEPEESHQVKIVHDENDKPVLKYVVENGKHVNSISTSIDDNKENKIHVLKADEVNTGDSFNAYPYMFGLFSSLISIGGVVYLKKKKSVKYNGHDYMVN